MRRRQLVCGCANRSFPERNADYQRFLVHDPPILNLPLPFLVVNPGSLREPEPPQHPAEQHPHLHQCQILARADRRTVRERYECGCVVFSRRCALAEPPFGQKCLWCLEVTRVPVDTIGIEEELRLLRDDPARCEHGRMRTYFKMTNSAKVSHRFPSTLAPLPLSTERCEPLGTGG